MKIYLFCVCVCECQRHSDECWKRIHFFPMKFTVNAQPSAIKPRPKKNRVQFKWALNITKKSNNILIKETETNKLLFWLLSCKCISGIHVYTRTQLVLHQMNSINWIKLVSSAVNSGCPSKVSCGLCPSLPRGSHLFVNRVHWARVRTWWGLVNSFIDELTYCIMQWWINECIEWINDRMLICWSDELMNNYHWSIDELM